MSECWKKCSQKKMPLCEPKEWMGGPGIFSWEKKYHICYYIIIHNILDFNFYEKIVSSFIFPKRILASSLKIFFLYRLSFKKTLEAINSCIMFSMTSIKNSFFIWRHNQRVALEEEMYKILYLRFWFWRRQGNIIIFVEKTHTKLNLYTHCFRR